MKWLSAPVEVSLELTNTCNLECIHCYSSSGPIRVDHELAYPEIAALIDQLVALKVFRLQLVGGEPFIRTDTLDIIRYAKQSGLAVTCSTNGYFLDDSRLALLKQYGLDNVQVSIDGAHAQTHDSIRRRHGSFGKAVDAACRAKKAGISTTVGSTLMRRNYSEVPDIVELALDLRADALHLMGLQPGGRGRDCFRHEALPDAAWIEIVRYFEGQRSRLQPSLAVTIQGARFAAINQGMVDASDLGTVDPLDAVFTNCDCGKARCVIDSRGNVMPCDMWRAFDMNIRDTPLQTIWNESQVFKSIRARDVRAIADCAACGLAQWCRGGCAATAFNVFGRFDAADPRCAIAARSS